MSEGLVTLVSFLSLSLKRSFLADFLGEHLRADLATCLSFSLVFGVGEGDDKNVLIRRLLGDKMGDSPRTALERVPCDLLLWTTYPVRKNSNE